VTVAVDDERPSVLAQHFPLNQFGGGGVAVAIVVGHRPHGVLEGLDVLPISGRIAERHPIATLTRQGLIDGSSYTEELLVDWHVPDAPFITICAFCRGEPDCELSIMPTT
jgi:hypothetical protein